jgi:hypothetical protein
MSDPDHAVSWTLSEALAWGQRRDPPDAFRDFLTTLHQLCSSGRVQAIGIWQDGGPCDALVPIAVSDWPELYFDSDGEQLRSGDLFSGVLHRRRAWTSVRFSQADLVREWPGTGAAAFATELADEYWRVRFSARSERSIQERRRREWIGRFAAKQRHIRRWIPFVDIADECARAASPVSITEEDEVRALAYRRLVDSMARGEFEKNGRSCVLLLLPNLNVSVPPHRLTHEYFQGMVHAYGVADFTSDSGLVREHLWFCWLPADLCREWFKRHRLAWPDEFSPQDQTLDALPRSQARNPKIEIAEPQVADAGAPEKGRPGRKRGSGSLDDDNVLLEMLWLLADGKAASVHAAARCVVDLGVAKITTSAESVVTRLRGKFAARFGTELPLGKTWSDVAHTIQYNSNRNAIRNRP